MVPDRQGKGRGENKSTTELTKKEGGTEGGKGEGEGGGGDKEKEAEDMNVDTATGTRTSLVPRPSARRGKAWYTLFAHA